MYDVQDGFNKVVIRNARGHRPHKYPFEIMKVNSYFKAGPFRPGTDEVDTVQKRLNSARSAAERRMPGRKFSVRKNILVGGLVEILVGRYK